LLAVSYELREAGPGAGFDVVGGADLAPGVGYRGPPRRGVLEVRQRRQPGAADPIVIVVAGALFCVFAASSIGYIAWRGLWNAASFFAVGTGALCSFVCGLALYSNLAAYFGTRALRLDEGALSLRAGWPWPSTRRFAVTSVSQIIVKTRQQVFSASRPSRDGRRNLLSSLSHELGVVAEGRYHRLFGGRLDELRALEALLENRLRLADDPRQNVAETA
jgi:hypothetical protein